MEDEEVSVILMPDFGITASFQGFLALRYQPVKGIVPFDFRLVKIFKPAIVADIVDSLTIRFPFLVAPYEYLGKSATPTRTPAFW